MFLSNPSFIILAGTGAVFVIVGLVTLKNPPRKINNWYGYRTTSSMKSQARWDFAQQYSSRFMMKLGQLLIITSVPAALVKLGDLAGPILAVLVIVASSIYMIVSTERAIKNKFGVN